MINLWKNNLGGWNKDSWMRVANLNRAPRATASWEWWKREARSCLGEEHSRKKELQVQWLWGRCLTGMFKKELMRPVLSKWSEQGGRGRKWGQIGNAGVWRCANWIGSSHSLWVWLLPWGAIAWFWADVWHILKGFWLLYSEQTGGE